MRAATAAPNSCWATAEQSPFDDNTADVSFTTHTIYFMPDPQTTLHEVARVLRPGGRLVIACRVSDDATPPWMDPTIYTLPTIEQLKTLVQNAGFEPVIHHPGSLFTHWTHWFVSRLQA